jgi:hypothetical protein
MSGEIEDEKMLQFDLRFALRGAPVCRSRDERSSDSWRNLVADKIIAHLKLANWVIRRGEPLAMAPADPAPPARNLDER